MNGGIFRANLKVRLAAIILLAVTIQAFIPAGFMPDAKRLAGSFITICSGSDVKTIHVAGDQAPDHPDEPPCVFAFTPMADQQAKDVVVAALVEASVPAAAPRAQNNLVASVFIKPSYATGPPALL